MRKLILILLLFISNNIYAQTADITILIHNSDGTSTALTGTLPGSNSNNSQLPLPIPNKFGYGGQSNMCNLVNFGFWPNAGATLYGYCEGNQTIDYFTNGNGWTQMSAALQGHLDLHAFVFYLGETDNIIGTSSIVFINKLTAMIAKIRNLLNNSSLPIWLSQINQQYTTINSALQSVANTVANVFIIPTVGCEYASDNIHLDNSGATCWVNEVMAHP